MNGVNHFLKCFYVYLWFYFNITCTLWSFLTKAAREIELHKYKIYDYVN